MNVLTESDSRAATNELLDGLRGGRWRPGAWARFLASSSARSVRQAGRRPRALAQLTTVHAVFALLAGRRGRRWVAASWALSACHLGMLEARDSVGLPTVITLTRANLPALGHRVGPWLPLLALASDFVDGKLARRTGTVTRFGAYADALADATFWTWYTLRHDPSKIVRVAAVAAWILPTGMITALSIRRGRMLETPRPVLLRPSAGMQIVVTVRALRRAGTDGLRLASTAPAPVLSK